MTQTDEPGFRTPLQQAITFASLACFACFLIITVVARTISDFFVFEGWAEWLLFGLVPIFASFASLCYCPIRQEMTKAMRALFMLLISCGIYLGMMISFGVVGLVLAFLFKNSPDQAQF